VDIKSETQLAEEEAGYGGEDWAEGEWVTDDSGEMVWKPADGSESLTADQWSSRDTGGEAAPTAPPPASNGDATPSSEPAAAAGDTESTA
jgi:N utilization substance protein A